MYLHYVAIDSIHDSNFIQDRPNGIIDYLFLFIKSPSTLIIYDKHYTITKPTAILLKANTPHKYFPTGTEYIDDYLHFAVDNPKNFLDELTFPLNQPIPILKDSAIHQILVSIQKEDVPDHIHSQRIVTLLIQLLLLKVGEEWDTLQQEHKKNPHYKDLLDIRNQILNSPEKSWVIEELAEKAHLSHAYFQVLYKKTFGVTCITDVIYTKLSKAKVLLTSTNLSVKEIAQELGYSEVYHFIRQFKKYNGMTPGAFRKMTT